MKDSIYDEMFQYVKKYLKENGYKHDFINPMVTSKAKEFWKSKQDLMQQFIEQLSFDLGISDDLLKS